MVGGLWLCSNLTCAQNPEDVLAVRAVIKELYALNTKELKCYTLKSGVSRQQHDAIIKRFSGHDSFVKKTEVLYDWSSKDQTYWMDFYSRFFTSQVASKIAPLCDRANRLWNSNHFADDLRYPMYLAQMNTADELIVMKIEFKDLKQEIGGLTQYAKVYLKTEPAFLMRYLFHKEKIGWRISDMVEYHDDPDRKDVLETSLQDELRDW